MIFQLNDPRATPADQVMVMIRAGWPTQFVARHTVAQVEPLHQGQCFQQVEAPVHGGQVTRAGAEAGMDFPAAERPAGLLHGLENRATRPGQPPRLLMQPCAPLRVGTAGGAGSARSSRARTAG